MSTLDELSELVESYGCHVLSDEEHDELQSELASLRAENGRLRAKVDAADKLDYAAERYTRKRNIDELDAALFAYRKAGKQ